MKKSILCLLILFLAAGCGNQSNSSSVRELEVSDYNSVDEKRLEDTIAKTGEVDRFHLNLVETGRVLQIRCSSNTLRPTVDLLVHVFEIDEGGNLRMIAGTHAPDDGIQPADLKLNLYVDRPKELYVHVRDLQDNESSNNPYYISAHFEAAPDGNGTFENATAVTPGGDPVEDTIGSIGDTDCFGITITTAGVYDTNLLFSPLTGTAVRLDTELFDPDGTLLETRDMGDETELHMVRYFEPGTYTLVVNDDGKDDFDAASPYTVSVTANSPHEAMLNDVPANAQVAGTAAFNGASIDYATDIDWYRFTPDTTNNIHILELTFDSDISLTYRINLYRIAESDIAGFEIAGAAPVFSHDFSGVNDPAWTSVLKLDNLDPNEGYYLAVMPQNGSNVAGNSPYSLSIDLTSFNDPDEPNDTDAEATELVTGTHEGRLGYRSDVDWYYLTIPLPLANDSILSVTLETPKPNNVEYAVDIIRNVRNGEGDLSVGLNKTLRHTDTTFRNVDLNTGIVVPSQLADAGHGLSDIRYYIKVYDYQHDDGDTADYTLKWSLTPIPGEPAAIGGVTDPVYNDEKAERDSGSTDYLATPVTINMNSGETKTFRVNKTFHNLSSGSDSEDGYVTTIEMPWVSGFVDYQGDEDWYSIDLSSPYLPADTDWYYEVNVEMIAEGTSVEYIWEYMPDTNHNNEVSEGACSTAVWTPCNRSAALGGDRDIDDTVGFHDSYPQDHGAATPWIGSRDDTYAWKGTVFFRIRDFNFIRTDADTINTSPDNDWGFDKPYFFRVKILYHSGKACPDDTVCPQN